MAESKEELKILLMKVKEESGKSWLKTQNSRNKDVGILSHHFMTNRWEKMETVTDFIFLFSWALKSLQTITSAMKLKDA